MDKARWQKIEGILDEAMTMEKPERDEYIKEACNHSHTMIEEVNQMLDSIRAAEYYGFLEKD